MYGGKDVLGRKRRGTCLCSCVLRGRGPGERKGLRGHVRALRESCVYAVKSGTALVNHHTDLRFSAFKQL